MVDWRKQLNALKTSLLDVFWSNAEDVKVSPNKENWVLTANCGEPYNEWGNTLWPQWSGSLARSNQSRICEVWYSRVKLGWRKARAVRKISKCELIIKLLKTEASALWSWGTVVLLYWEKCTCPLKKHITVSPIGNRSISLFTSSELKRLQRWKSSPLAKRFPPTREFVCMTSQRRQGKNLCTWTRW